MDIFLRPVSDTADIYLRDPALIDSPVFQATDIILWPVEDTADIYLRDPALTIDPPVVPPTPSGGAPRRGKGWMPRKPPRPTEEEEETEPTPVKAPPTLLPLPPVEVAAPTVAPETTAEPVWLEPEVLPPAEEPIVPTPQRTRTRERIIFEPRPRRPRQSKLRIQRLKRQAEEERILIALASLL